MTVSPAVTKTSCTVPPWVRVMAAVSLALALPLPWTMLWMEEIWAGWVWIWLFTASFAVRKRYRKKPPTARTARTTRAMMVFRTFFRCFFFWLDVPLGWAGGAAGAGASVTGAFCCVISAMFGFLLSFL